jgi:hypothetical protein
MTDINWSLLQNGQNAFARNLEMGMRMGQAAREAHDEREAQTEMRNALAAVWANPDDKQAAGVLFQRNPELAMRVSDYQDQRAFRSALGDYMGGQTNALLGYGPSAPQPSGFNALALPQPDSAQTSQPFAPLAPGIEQAPQGAAVPQEAQKQGVDLSSLGQPESAQDRAFLRMVQIDPMRALEIQSGLRDRFVERAQAESEFYTVAVEELSRVSDEAGWQRALQRVAPIAQAMGADLSTIPTSYPGPEAVRELLENALPAKERLDYFLREANIEADNARADRNTDSMIATRDRRADIYAGNVAADNARADRNTDSLIANRGRRGGRRSGGSRSRSDGGSNGRTGFGRAAVRAGEPTATGANGETLVVRGGEWVEAE